MATTNKPGRFSKLGCYLIGWNSEILKECGEASHRTLRKYVSAILILTVIWGSIGFCFAERYIEVESLFAKIAIACVFVTIIICIERFIILTVGKLGAMGKVRFVLALLMAVLGSTVFDQIIFKNDVDVKMKEVRTEQINKEIPKRMAFLNSDIRKATASIDSIGKANIVLYDKIHDHPTIVTKDVITKKRQVGKDEDGKPIYENDYEVTKRNVENPLSALVKSNEKTIKRYQEKLDTYQKQKMSVVEDVRRDYAGKAGFLEELKALFGILAEDWIALVFYGFLFFFLTFLELLVVTSKGKDGSCDYDLIVEHQLKIKKKTLELTENKLLKHDH